MVSQELKIARAVAQAKRAELARTKVFTKTATARERSLLKLKPGPMLSAEQSVLNEMFGGSPRLWGTGDSLPVLNNSLTSGNGLINSGDDEEETASMFGMR